MLLRHILFTFLLCLFYSHVAGAQVQIQPARIGLLFGNQHFPGDRLDVDGNSRLGELPYAPRDVLRLALVLSDTELGRFSELHIFADSEELTSAAGTDPSLKAIAVAIKGNTAPFTLHSPQKKAFLATFDEVKDRLDSHGSILVYFASHGASLERTTNFRPISPENMALVTRDSHVDDYGGLNGYVTEAEILNKLDGTEAQHRVLIEATCHTPWDGTKRSTSQASANWRDNSRRTVIIGDSSPGQGSVELDSLEASVFTHYLLRALESPKAGVERMAAVDTDQDGAISLEEVYDYAADLTWSHTCQTKGVTCQSPFLLSQSYLRRTPFILSGQSKRAPSREARLVIHPQDSSRLRGAKISVDGYSLPDSEAVAQVISRGLHRIDYQPQIGRASVGLVWVGNSQTLRATDLVRQESSHRSVSLGLGPAMWLGKEEVTSNFQLHAFTMRDIVQNSSGSYRIDLGIGARLGAGQACFGGSCAVQLSTLSLSGEALGLLQTTIMLPTRLDFALRPGIEFGIQYLSLYDPNVWESGGVAKLHLLARPVIALAWHPKMVVVRNSESDNPAAHRLGWLQLQLGFQPQRTMLTQENFDLNQATWHMSGLLNFAWFRYL